ncbi:MAG: zinc-ribbon domain-containing protein [Desulfobacterales bacterium]|nr:zinc-ribbon domain-containing protein [Desulfobacterales bacterium]
MEIVCNSCQSKFRIPDEKIPAGRSASFLCPKCKNKITVGPAPDADPGPAPQPQRQVPSADAAAGKYDAAEKPFDFVETEGRTALLCETDAGLRQAVLAALNAMDYRTTEAGDTQDALKKMRYHVYDLVIANEAFDGQAPDTNAVLEYLENLNMVIRRNIFVVMVSDRFRTMDNMAAFNHSVNMIINSKNMDSFDKILRRGIADNELFYGVFKDSLKKAGRA